MKNLYLAITIIIPLILFNNCKKNSSNSSLSNNTNISTEGSAAITSPGEGSSFTIGTPFLIKATADDPAGVSVVRFRVHNGTTEEVVFADSESEYEYTWTATIPGTYQIYVKARNTNNELFESEKISITINDDPIDLSHSGSVLFPGEQLAANQYLISENGNFRLYMQTDGNLVLRNLVLNEGMWSSRTSDSGVVFKFLNNSNLELQNSTNSSIWSSGTTGYNATVLKLNNDATLVLYSGSTPVWSINTFEGMDTCPDDPFKIDPGQCGCGVPEGTCGPPDTSPLAFPVRAAFYYIWYPQTWKVDGSHVFYNPDLGYYDSDSLAVADRHIRCMEYAKIDMSILSWWGEDGHNEDYRVSLILNRTKTLKSNLKWAMYHEKEVFDRFDTSVPALEADLNYLKSKYTDDDAYAKIDGKPVIFVYNANDGTCDVADRWAEATNGEWHYVLKVFGGFRDCVNQPSSWHQYGPSTAESEHNGYSYVISPGFWRADEPTARLDRDISRWYQSVRNMIASGQPWQLITTINEWGEGTAIEPAAEWSSSSGYGQYLDALHTDGIE